MSLPAAVALELVHNSSLVHDDIQDRDTEQRHRPAVWSVWGMPQAITDGDGLLVLSNLPEVLCTVLYAQYSALSPCSKTAIAGRPRTVSRLVAFYP